MTTCSDCNNAKDAPLWSLYSLGCIYCGARLIQNIKRLPPTVSRDEKIERATRVADDWERWGHSRARLNELAAKGAPYPALPPASDAPPATASDSAPPSLPSSSARPSRPRKPARR